MQKYTMPAAEYETRTDSVLAWKKTQKLGRFDPSAPSIEQQKLQASEREIAERGECLVLSFRYACTKWGACLLAHSEVATLPSRPTN